MAKQSSTGPTHAPLLSIVVPAFNEEARLPASLDDMIAFADKQPYPVEILVIDNNSRDQTHAIVEQYAAKHANIRLLMEKTQGKGAAVRTGMLAARGSFRFVCDADLSMPIDEVSKFMPPALEGYDVAIGSREAPGAVRYNEPAYRHLMGRIFNTIVRLFAVHGFQDTQCGFKMFTAQATEALFPYQTLTGWGFDVEVLFIAQQRGYRIVEVPINWYYKDNTRIHPIRDSIDMFLDVMRIRRNALRGRYRESGKARRG